MKQKKISYSAKYIDDFETIETKIWNDGKKLTIEVRGVLFKGGSFNCLEAITNSSTKSLESFTLSQHRFLCNCKIIYDIPIDMKGNREIVSCILTMYLTLGKPNPPFGIDREDVILELKYGDKRISSCGKSGWFEDELLDLHRQFPAGNYLICCYSCAYSDYHPVGHDLFGGMLCFRGNKKEYLAIRTKDEFFDIDKTVTEFVQEIYKCSEFKIRIPGTGYRG